MSPVLGWILAVLGPHPSNMTDGLRLPPGPQDSVGQLSTEALIERARRGNHDALERLLARHLPSLTRWAHNRLPSWTRDLADTHDLVQDVLLHTLHRLDAFVPEGEAAFEAYLRRALVNRVRDELRRCTRRPRPVPLDSQLPEGGPSPYDQALAAQWNERYQVGLGALRPEDRELVVARVEMGMSYREIAVLTERDNANAARSAVVRALTRLASEMRREQR